MSRSLLESNCGLQKNVKSVRYIIAVAAGKGGVGKSSLSVNLALSLQKMGYQTAILDADIYGPSLGIMMPLEEEIQIKDEKIIPGIFQGVQVVSLSHLRPSQGMLVRAPVANGLIIHCIQETLWKETDYLIVDFPPGTGDIQLTLMQTLSFSGALLVTTPQEVAVVDVQKAAHMFHQMGVPVIGVVENMSYFLDPMGNKHYPFGKGGGEKIAHHFGIPFLGQIPLDEEVSKCGDLGIALPFAFPFHPISLALERVAVHVRDFLYFLEKADQMYLKPFEYQWKEMEC